MIPFTCAIFKNDTNELIYKTGIDSDTENRLTITRGKGEENELGVWDQRTLLCLK